MSWGELGEMILEYKEGKLPLPLVSETLRWESQTVQREETLEPSGQPVYSLGEGITGGFTLRLDQASIPLILALLLGSEQRTSHIPETRSTFHRQLSMNLSKDRPSFSILIDRGYGWIRYGGLNAIGFTLRAERDEAYLLRVEVEGESYTEIPYLEESVPELELPHYRFNEGDLLINGMILWECYQMELSVTRIDKGWNIHFLVFSPNSENLTQLEPGAPVSLNLCSTLSKEMEPNRYPEFSLELDRMLLKKQGGQIQGSGEIIGPWVFQGSYYLDATLRTHTSEALL